MDYKVFLSSDALTDLERIVVYIAPHNPKVDQSLEIVRFWHAARGFPHIELGDR